MIGLKTFVDRSEDLVQTLQNIKSKPIPSSQVLKSTKYNEVVTFRQKPNQVFDDLYESFTSLLERAKIINSNVDNEIDNENTTDNVNKNKEEVEEEEHVIDRDINDNKGDINNNNDNNNDSALNPDIIDVSSLLSAGVNTALGTLADIKMKSLNNFNLLLNKMRKSRKSKEIEYHTIKSNYKTSRELNLIDLQVTEKELELNEIKCKIEIEKKFLKLLKDHGHLEAAVVEKMLYDNIIEMKEKLLDKIENLKRKISDIEYDQNNHNITLEQLKDKASIIYQNEGNDNKNDMKNLGTTSITSTTLTKNEINYNEKAIYLLNELFSMAMESLKVASAVNDKRKQFETLINSDQAKVAANLKEKVAMRNIQVKNLEINVTELIELRDRHQSRAIKDNKNEKKATTSEMSTTTVTKNESSESTPETITNTTNITNTDNSDNDVNNIVPSVITPEMLVIARGVERIALQNLTLNEDGLPDDSDLVINKSTFSNTNNKQIDDDDLNVEKNFGVQNDVKKLKKLNRYQRSDPAQESLLRIAGGIEGIRDVEDRVDECRNYDNDFGISMAVNQMRKLLYVFNTAATKESDVQLVTNDLRAVKKKIRKYELDINRRLQLLKKNEDLLKVVKNERDDARRCIVPHVEELREEMPVLHNGVVMPNERFVRDPKAKLRNQNHSVITPVKRQSTAVKRDNKHNHKSNGNDLDLGESTTVGNKKSNQKIEPQLEYVMEEDDVLLLEKDHTYEDLHNKLLNAENEEKKILEQQDALKKKIEKLNEYEFKDGPKFAKPVTKRVVVQRTPEIKTPPPSTKFRKFTMNLKKRNTTLITKQKQDENSNKNNNIDGNADKNNTKLHKTRPAIANRLHNSIKTKTETTHDSKKTRKDASIISKKFPHVYLSKRTTMVSSFSEGNNKPRHTTLQLHFDDDNVNELNDLRNKLGIENVKKRKRQSFKSALAAIQQKKLQRVLAKRVPLGNNLPVSDTKPRRFEELKLSSSFWSVKLHEELTKMKHNNINEEIKQQPKPAINSATIPIIEDNFLTAIEILENDIKTTLDYVHLVGGGSSSKTNKIYKIK